MMESGQVDLDHGFKIVGQPDRQACCSFTEQDALEDDEDQPSDARH